MQQSERFAYALPEDPYAADVESSPAASRVAHLWATGVLTLMLLNLILVVWFVIRTGNTRTFLSHQTITPLVSIVYAGLGVAIIRRRARNPIGWIFLSVSTFYVLSSLTAGIELYRSILPGQASPLLLDLTRWLNNWIWLPAQILPITFVFLLFPDGHLLSTRWRVISWAAGLGLAALMLGLAAHPGPVSDWGTLTNPYGIAGAEDALEILINAGGFLLAIGIGGSIVAVIARFRRSRGLERAQMKLLVYAAAVMMILSFFTIPLWLAGNLVDPLAMELSIIVMNLMTLGIAVAATVAIVRYRLYDIDVLINRTLVYAVMTGFILLIYGLVVGMVGFLFESQGNWLLAVLATGLVAVLFQPIRNRLQRGINRLLYGQRDEPFEVMTRLGQRLEQTISPDSAYPTIVETVAQAMRLPYVAIQLPLSSGVRTVESYGVPAGELRSYELTHQGETVGWLQVSQRAPDEALNSADERLLRNIARQAGSAVRNVQLTADLQRSRQQIVNSREEERRRLRRDLHDGLGPSLASLLLEARVVRRMIREDPTAAESLAEEMQRDIRATIDDIRRVVNELRPPALDDLGLVNAIRVMADKLGRSSTAVTAGPMIEVSAPDDLPPFPAAVEVAAYRIIQEALTNLIRHAQAHQACICLTVDRELHIEISDDGVGFNSTREGGLGVRSMRERAAELGGSLSVSRRPEGGTLVRAVLPLGGI